MSVDLTKLNTEQQNPDTINIDRVSTLEMVQMMNKEDHKVADAVEKALPQIAKAIECIADVLLNGGRLFYVGAGNSGRLGVLDACECPPTFSVDEGTVIGILAGGYDACVYSKEGSEDYPQPAIDELKKHELTKQDIIVGISASGRTPFVKGALSYGKELGCQTIAVSCVDNAEISNLSDVSIEVVCGPEVISGSTRLKAGTAQKMILNMLSTGAMIKVGKVYHNYMVDVRSHNEKLQERGRKIVMNVTGVSYEEAEQYLVQTERKVKPAIFMILSKLNKIEAEEVLKKHNQVLFKALKSL